MIHGLVTSSWPPANRSLTAFWSVLSHRRFPAVSEVGLAKLEDARRLGRVPFGAVVVAVDIGAVDSGDGGRINVAGAPRRLSDVDVAVLIGRAQEVPPPAKQRVDQLRVKGHVDPGVQARVEREQPEEPCEGQD